MKRCLNCNKEIILSETNNPYLKSNFKFKKFCDNNCQIDFNNKLKKKAYLLKETEHNNKLKELNNLIKGDFIICRGKKDSYSPDISKENIDYEMELFRNMNHLKDKVKRWDSSRKHVLIITISDQTKDLFDEVYFFTKGNLLREK